MTPAKTLKAPVFAAVTLVVIWLALQVWNLSEYYMIPSDWGWAAKALSDTLTKAVLWTAGWALATRFLQGQARLSEHIVIVAAASLIDEGILGLAMPWLFFAVGWDWPRGINELLWMLLVVATSYLNLRVACGAITRRLLGIWVLAVSMGASVFSLKTWGELNDREAAEKLPFMSNIYPATWVRTPELGVEEGLGAMWGRGSLLRSDQK